VFFFFSFSYSLENNLQTEKDPIMTSTDTTDLNDRKSSTSDDKLANENHSNKDDDEKEEEEEQAADEDDDDEKDNSVDELDNDEEMRVCIILFLLKLRLFRVFFYSVIM